MLIMPDLLLNVGTIIRPDASFGLRPGAIPTPPPARLKFLPNGDPYPNIVVEVVVNNERPNTLKEDCHRYFGNMTSVRVWIGVKVWVAGKKFSVWWADRDRKTRRDSFEYELPAE